MARIMVKKWKANAEVGSGEPNKYGIIARKSCIHFENHESNWGYCGKDWRNDNPCECIVLANKKCSDMK